MRARNAIAAGVTLTLLLGCFSANQPADAGADAGDASTCFFCVDSGPIISPWDTDASLGVRTRALFAQTCAGGPESGCHSEHAANLTLTLDPDGGDVINVPSTEMPPMVRVAPYQPDASYLYWKVSGDPRIDGGVMPLYAPFDPRIPGLVGEWIEAGAP